MKPWFGAAAHMPLTGIATFAGHPTCRPTRCSRATPTSPLSACPSTRR